jgi:glutathione S-transferase
MRLHHSHRSPYARKVVVLAHETGLMAHLELVTSSVSPIAMNDGVAADNPLGKIPCLVTDEGEPLYDSRVICEYLDSRHTGHKLFPHEGPARWVALRRQALADGICDASLLARYETVLRPKDREWQDWADGQTAKVRRCLDRLAAEAESFPALSDIGLIAIAVALGYRDFRFPEDDWRATRPKLAAWYETFAKRPSMQETMPPEE